MRSVRVLEAAAAEAAEAAAWYEDQRPGLGSEFRSEFRAAIDRLHEGVVPGKQWRGPLGERGVRRLLMRRFPFSVVFVTAGAEDAVVLAIAHQRRRPNYWRDRLGKTTDR